MATRVLSSEQGKTSITRMTALLNEGLAEQIKALQTEGTTLSDPNVWDGQKAEDFRSNTWPSASTSLNACAEALVTLSNTVKAINQDIMSAGGNS